MKEGMMDEHQHQLEEVKAELRDLRTFAAQVWDQAEREGLSVPAFNPSELGRLLAGQEGRYEIRFEGSCVASEQELGPSLSDLFEGDPSLDTFLGVWNYGEVLHVTVTDSHTGEQWAREGNDSWEQIWLPEGDG